MAVPCSELMLTSQDKPAALQLQVLARRSREYGQCSNKGHKQPLSSAGVLALYRRASSLPLRFRFIVRFFRDLHRSGEVDWYSEPKPDAA